MAPEVIEQSGYDFKADIWSLGITTMEMANAEPPNASTHPMKVLFLIPKAPAPRLQGNQYSRDLKDFVAACLVKDPDHRPTAKELLQHRFIRSAGRVECLQEVVRRRQAWDCNKGSMAHPKLYEETLKSMSIQADNDDWVFDTVKASTIVTQKHSQNVTQYQTMKRRKISSSQSQPQESPESMLSRLTLEENSQRLSPPPPTTMRKATVKRRPSLPTSASATKRRASGQRKPSGQKLPLEPSLNFGNSASTVRQFSRVSDQSPGVSPTASLVERDENQPPLAAAITKEALIGRRAYSKAIDPAFQETYSQTGNQAKREAISRVSDAWSALDQDDPEGEYHLLKLIIEKVQR